MSWREKLVVQILLLVARIVAAGISQFDADLAKEIKAIATHISVWVPKESSSDV